ncbi:MAG: HyaD/HybD family hydrogenase maturation endopeptidase [Gammaproteobacteria bacterium]|nr:HyaD/HybD family hydrogenase maturation endopeptidase [Gammaproteobacteria bacterium]
MLNINSDLEFDTLILGIGNVLWADEGFGVRAVEALHAEYRVPPGVRLMDGGTQGMFLLPYVCQVQRLLIFDAIDFGLEPGALRVIREENVPRYLGAKKISMHQTGLQEVLASADLLGDCPKQLVLIGVQPVVLDDYGGSLRPPVKAQIPTALRAALSILAEWERAAQKRKTPLAELEYLNPPELGIAPYEDDRPQL